MHESINFSHILSDNKKTNTVTPPFYLSFRKNMPNTTIYSKSRKMAIFLYEQFRVFSLKFHDFPFKSIHYCQNDTQLQNYCLHFFVMHGKVYIFWY